MDGFRSPLFILVGVQTVIVAALFFKASDLEKRFDAAASSTPAALEVAPAIAPSPFTSSSLSEREIRAILRDELAALKSSLADNTAAPAPAPSPQRTAATDRAFTDVQQELRRVIAKGSASEKEMAALEARIAELPADQRQQALSQLSGAVTNGSLKARM